MDYHIITPSKKVEFILCRFEVVFSISFGLFYSFSILILLRSDWYISVFLNISSLPHLSVSVT